MADLGGILDPSLVAELEALRRRMATWVRSGGPGERVARRKGSSAEFEEHRAYYPGDDLRRVDWLAFARSGVPVVKTFRAEEDAVVRLLVDGSASLGFGDPSKLWMAQRLAAAIGYFALAGSQRVSLSVARRREGGGGALSRWGTPQRGRGAVHSLLAEVARIEARGTGDLTAAIDEVLRRSQRPGMLVVVSDFLDSGAVTRTLDQARTLGHDVVLVHVLAREELEPDLEGDLALVDVETGEEVEVSVDPAVVLAYARRLAGLVEALRVWARQHRASYLRVVSDEAVDASMRRFIARGVD